jgi:hypothetical protein
MSNDNEHPGGRRKAYVTGYGQPPVSGQFKKGKSGNPRGRPKGRESTTTIIRRLLDQTLGGFEDGVPVERTFRELKIRRLIEKAIKSGDPYANEYLDKHDYPEPEVPDEIPVIRLKLEG